MFCRSAARLFSFTVVFGMVTQVAAVRGQTLLDLRDALYACYGRMDTRLLNFDLMGADPMAEMNDGECVRCLDCTVRCLKLGVK